MNTKMIDLPVSCHYCAPISVGRSHYNMMAGVCLSLSVCRVPQLKLAGLKPITR